MHKAPVFSVIIAASLLNPILFINTLLFFYVKLLKRTIMLLELHCHDMRFILDKIFHVIYNGTIFLIEIALFCMDHYSVCDIHCISLGLDLSTLKSQVVHYQERSGYQSAYVDSKRVADDKSR